VVRSAGFLAEFFIQFHEHTGKDLKYLFFVTPRLGLDSDEKERKICEVLLNWLSIFIINEVGLLSNISKSVGSS
jgi:hypothetical protein